MSDVFAGGAAKIKDRVVDDAPPARRSFELKNLPPASTPPVADDEQDSQIVTSKFKMRGGAGGSSSLRNTASRGAAAGEGAASGAVQQPFAALFSRGPKSNTKHPRRASPPPPTPTSSGEQMPPPPIASQRHLPSTHVDTPRRSTSRSSTGSSKNMHSGDEGGRKSAGGRGATTESEQRGGQARSAEQQQRKGGGAAPSFERGARHALEPRTDDSNDEQLTKTASRSSSEEDEEETPLFITEDRPTPSPMIAGDVDQDEELVMSGAAGAEQGDAASGSSEEGSSSEEEDEVVLAGQGAIQVGIKRDREYGESEDESEYKRRDFGRRSPTATESFVEYRSPDSHSQDDALHSYEQQQQHAGFGFARPDHLMQHENAYATSNHARYPNDAQQSPTTRQTHFDPLASVAELFPGTHPHLQQAQARLHAQHHSVGSESPWENCSLEEWKEGGDELAKRFGALVGRVVTLVAKKSSRTEGFKRQMQEHRDELQQEETKLEGTKEGLSKWAAVVGLGGSS